MTRKDPGRFLFWFFLLGVYLAMSLIPPSRQSLRVYRPAQGSANAEQTVRKAFRWQEIDGRVIDMSFTFPRVFLLEALESFGVLSSRRNHSAFLLRNGFKVVEWQHRVEGMGGKPVERIRLRIDYERIFADFRIRMVPYAAQLKEALLLKKGSDPLLSFLNFVQRIPYKQPPEIYHKRYINGYFVPPICLAEGYGDCDSKAVLLADLLASGYENEGRLGMALIDGRGVAHSVLLVQRAQLPGMSSIYADKYGRYLPVETTAPGWNPGFLSPILIDLMKEGRFTFVPFE